MDEESEARCSCQHCGVHLEFPRTAAGAEVDCPQCHGKTVLTLPEDFDPGILEAPALRDDALDIREVLNAFGQQVKPTSVSLLYKFGLLLVALMMVLLPVVYLGMVGLAAWATWRWGSEGTSLLSSRVGGPRVYIFQLLCYIAPLFAGVVLVLFMVKPLFARRARRAQPLALNPGAEPALFAFVAKICEVVGAPMPKRVDFDCQLNASASFRRGAISLLHDDLVLTIGLPLAAGLTLREFAGVLAHEFGHFTQGFGMRLSYIIRSVNGWFARVAYERDAWDVALEEWGASSDARVALVVGLARLAVWASRQILTLLMLVGHLIGCFMLRQMEYDADSYEIKVAGSEAFESCTRRMHVLSSLLEQSYKNMRSSWNLNKHLPDNFPAYLLQHDARLSADQRSALEDRMGLKATGLLETHPSNGDRIRRARQADLAGIFHLDSPASALFSRFEILAKQVTLLHYSDDLGIPLFMAKLRPVEGTPGTEQRPVADAQPLAGANPLAVSHLKLKLHKPE